MCLIPAPQRDAYMSGWSWLRAAQPDSINLNEGSYLNLPFFANNGLQALSLSISWADLLFTSIYAGMET
jgi:hypothetical protein